MGTPQLGTASVAAVVKAALFTAAVTLLGAYAVFQQWGTATIVPFALLYACILLNTYFSVRCFSTLARQTLFQQCVDVTLALLYVSMAWTIGQPLSFALSCGLMFVVASMKYAAMLGTLPHLSLLRYKIMVDALGAGGALVALAGMSAIDALTFAWAWAIGFILAQGWIFLYRPLYVIPTATR